MTSFKPKELLERAQAAEKKGDTRLASVQYALLCTYLQKKGSWKEAKLLIDRAIRLSPRSARLYVHRARCEINLGREAEARSAIDLFATYAAEKKKTEAYMSYLEENLAEYPDLRRSYYDGILRLDRTRAFPFLGLASCCLQLKDAGGAKRALIDGLKTDDRRAELIEKLRHVVGTHETGLEAIQRFEAGEIGTEQLSLALVEKVVPKEADAIPESTQAEAEEVELDLKGLIEKMEEELGIESSRDSVAPLVKEFRNRSQPILNQDAKTRLDIAFAFLEMELFKDAREEVSRIPSSDRFFLEGQCLLGDILYAEGSTLAALDVYQRCLRSDGLEEEQKRHCRYQAIEIYFSLGDYARAKDHITLLEKSDPDYRNLRQFKQEIAEKERLRKVS